MKYKTSVEPRVRSPILWQNKVGDSSSQLMRATEANKEKGKVLWTHPQSVSHWWDEIILFHILGVFSTIVELHIAYLLIKE